MISTSEIKRIYNEIKAETNSNTPDSSYQTFIEFFAAKFPEVNSIFPKLDNTSINEFCLQSQYQEYEENSEIFKKGEICNSYYFIIYGDINLYDEEFNPTVVGNKLLKTISAGNVYGHKIKSNFNFFAVAKNKIYLIKIEKNVFDNIIESTNKRKEDFKNIFLKKFFPKFRMYTDDIIKTLKSYFIREQYEKYSKIIIDKEYDEFVYLIIRGTVGVVKSVKAVKNLKDKLDSLHFDHNTKYVLLEKLEKGDIFGVYSALKHHKNNYSVMVLTENAEVYKLPKSHCLYYFGGSSGIIPEALKGLDTVQQVSIGNKIEFTEKCKDINEIAKFEFISLSSEMDDIKTKKLVDESEIENVIKDAWKDLENLGSKISEFKMNLLKGNAKASGTAASDIFNKIKTQEKEVEMKDHTKLMGFGTNRVVSKGLNKTGLSATQMKGMSTLQNICGVKKESKPESEVINKLSALKNLEDKPKKSRLLSGIEAEDGEIKSNETDKISQNSEEKGKGDVIITENNSTSDNLKVPAKKKLGFSLKNLEI